MNNFICRKNQKKLFSDILLKFRNKKPAKKQAYNILIHYYIEKEEPQPQVVVALGLLTTKRLPSKLSR